MRNAPAIAIRFPWPLLGLLAACGGLAGCGERAPKVPAAAGVRSEAADLPTAAPIATGASTASAAVAAAQAPAATPAATLSARLAADGPALSFALFSAPDAGLAAGVLPVRRIEISGPDGALLQRIDGLDTQTPWSEQFRGLEFVDVDFDGFADLRLVESQPAGPDLPYRNWRYDAAARHFVAAPELDALAGLQIDAAVRELRSSWRDSPSNYGVDVWTYREGRLIPLRRERRHYSAPGFYTLEVSQAQAGGGWKVTQRRPGRDR